MLPLILFTAVAAAEVTAPTPLAVDTYARCLAETQPRVAERALRQPMFSDGQQLAIRKMRDADVACINRGQGVAVRDARALVAGLAEQLYLTRFERAGSQLPVSQASLQPRNGSEDVALCLAAKNPSAARALIETEPGSAAERAAVRTLSGDLGPCLPQNQTFSLDPLSVRTFAAAGLYLSASGDAQVATR